MESDNDYIAKIAWYYYIQKKTQKEIAELLNISRMRVIRLLEKAEQENLVQIHIRKDFSDRFDVEKQLAEKFNLKDVVIIPADKQRQDLIPDELAKAASIYIKEHFFSNIINIGYGKTVGKILNNLSQISEKKLTFVSLTGGVSLYLLNNQYWAGNANLYLIPAPLIASTTELVDAIKKESAAIEISKMHEMAECTVVGIGAMSEDTTMLKSGTIRKETFELIRMRGAVGDILAYFFDENGQLVENEIYNNLISYPLDKLSKLKNVIGVAGGESKRHAIKAALCGNYVNILITDEDTAKWLLK